jgi:hypothetical protein
LKSFVLEDSLVVVGRRVRELAVLNATGRFVWERRELNWEPSRIALHLSMEYGIDRQQARSDVDTCLEAWARAGLLDTAGDEEPETADIGTFSPVGPDSRPHREFRACRYELGGQLFRVEFGSRELHDEAAPLLAHLAATSKDEPLHLVQLVETEEGYSLWRNGRRIESAATCTGLIFALQHELFEIGYDRAWCVGLHAAAIADSEVSVVLAGQGGSGKSTLTAALLQFGFVYLSDDVVPLDSRDRAAVPLPVCLNLKSGSLPVLERYYPGIRALPGYPAGNATVHYFPPPGFAENPPRGSYPVSHLVFPRYQAGARTDFHAIGAVEAFRGLVEGGSVVRRWSAAAVEELVECVKSIPAYSLVFGDLDEAASCVRGLFKR